MVGILTDEHISRRRVEALRKAGADVVSAQYLGLTGATDAVIAEVARAHRRVVLTRDADFLRLSTGSATPGEFPPIAFWAQQKPLPTAQWVIQLMALVGNTEYEVICGQVFFL